MVYRRNVKEEIVRKVDGDGLETSDSVTLYKIIIIHSFYVLLKESSKTLYQE